MSTPGGSLGALPRAAAKVPLPFPCHPALALPGALFPGGSGPLWLPRLTCGGPYLLEGHHGPRLLHHGVLLVALDQVTEGVEPLPASHIVLPVWLRGRQ